MEKINVAEILKDCPHGMELNCVMNENVYFGKICDDEDCIYPIRCYMIEDGVRTSINFTKYGEFNTIVTAKCVIYPKGKTTWEGFHRPFKDGDIVVYDNPYRKHLQVFIFKNKEENNTLSSCYLMLDGDELDLEEGMYYITRLATEDEEQKLFKAIKDNGYKWNPETKTLEKLPKFKVGDRIRHKDDKTVIHTINYIYHDSYGLCDNHLLFFKEQDQYELVPNKFDITTLKPFKSEVLIRNDKTQKWIPAFWGYKANNGNYVTTFGTCRYCIPFEGNENLLTTNNDCDDYFKTWE